MVHFLFIFLPCLNVKCWTPAWDLPTQFEYLNSLSSPFNLAEGFSGKRPKFSSSGRAGDAATPGGPRSAFGAVLLPSAGPGSAAPLRFYSFLLAPSRASPGQSLAWTRGICQNMPTVTPCAPDPPWQQGCFWPDMRGGLFLKTPAHNKNLNLCKVLSFTLHWVRTQKLSVCPSPHSYSESGLWGKEQLPAWTAHNQPAGLAAS